MFFISVKQEDLPHLQSAGVAVRINGQPETLHRDGDYLTYGTNRCKILSAQDKGELVSFVCASHGDEDEPHAIIRADGARHDNDD